MGSREWGSSSTHSLFPTPYSPIGSAILDQRFAFGSHFAFEAYIDLLAVLVEFLREFRRSVDRGFDVDAERQGSVDDRFPCHLDFNVSIILVFDLSFDVEFGLDHGTK